MGRGNDRRRKVVQLRTIARDPGVARRGASPFRLANLVVTAPDLQRPLPSAARPTRRPSGPVRDLEGIGRLRATIEALHAERIRLLRQRRIHLIMLGLAISLPFHIAIALWLASVYLPAAAGPTGPEVVFELGVLNDEKLADGATELEALPLEDSAAIAGDLPSALEATTPAVAADRTSTGALEAAGGGPVGPGSPSSGGGLGIGGGAGGTSFFGVGGRGSRFAYVVDVSGSMSQDDRLAIAFEELKRSIGALPDYASLLLLLFSDRTFQPPFQNGYLRAMPGNVTRVKRWLDEVGPMGGTDPSSSFELIFNMDPPPDIVFFLTDGEIPPHIAGWIASRNGREGKKRFPIHCIAFSPDAGQEPLRKIARESEGTFRAVPVRGVRP